MGCIYVQNEFVCTLMCVCCAYVCMHVLGAVHVWLYMESTPVCASSPIYFCFHMTPCACPCNSLPFCFPLESGSALLCPLRLCPHPHHCVSLSPFLLYSYTDPGKLKPKTGCHSTPTQSYPQAIQLCSQKPNWDSSPCVPFPLI